MIAPTVAELIERQFGLDVTSLGPSAVRQAVADQMGALDVSDEVEFAARIRRDSDTLAELVDRLVVSETWFFRGAGLFDELASLVVASRGQQTVRVLSLPCSTGEEPYSLAMALLMRGSGTAGIAIKGVDVSPRLIELARRGVYRELSFRHCDEAVRQSFFRATGDEWELSPEVRAVVDFRVGNIVVPASFGHPSSYSVILCRNLLVYFTPAARRRALDELDRLLAPAGLLVVGHAEPQLLEGRPYRRIGAEGSFIYQRQSGSIKAKETAAVRRRPTSGRAGSPKRSPSRPAASPPTKRQEAVGAENGTQLTPRELADAGDLSAALAACRAAQVTAPSADGFCLEGVILQARGEEHLAAEAYRKALYLDPGHREALTHATLHAERRGDVAVAQALRDRLTRLGGDS